MWAKKQWRRDVLGFTVARAPTVAPIGSWGGRIHPALRHTLSRVIRHTACT